MCFVTFCYCCLSLRWQWRVVKCDRSSSLYTALLNKIAPVIKLSRLHCGKPHIIGAVFITSKSHISVLTLKKMMMTFILQYILEGR